VDIVKDDELIGDAPFNRMVDRVRAYMESARRADDEKGEKTLYTVNITTGVEKLRDAALRAIDAGVNALMVNYLTVGVDAARALAEDPDITVPILGHFDFAGVWYESPFSGVSSHIVNGILPRLAGVDMVITPNTYGKFPFLRERHLRIGQHLLAPWRHLKPVWPMPGGGVNHAAVPSLVADFGNDFIVAAGGAIHGHPQGAAAGARALRQAIDVAVKGGDMEAAACECGELGAAVQLWGLPGKPAAGIYELKED
jgi:2,3-diketo-5-methylthiopentyl-1-phosphate enolase